MGRPRIVPNPGSTWGRANPGVGLTWGRADPVDDLWSTWGGPGVDLRLILGRLGEDPKPLLGRFGVQAMSIPGRSGADPVVGSGSIRRRSLRGWRRNAATSAAGPVPGGVRSCRTAPRTGRRSRAGSPGRRGARSRDDRPTSTLSVLKPPRAALRVCVGACLRRAEARRAARQALGPKRRAACRRPPRPWWRRPWWRRGPGPTRSRQTGAPSRVPEDGM